MSYPILDNFEYYVDIDDILLKTGANKIVYIAVFGSMVYGNFNPISDHDIMVVVDGPDQNRIEKSDKEVLSYDKISKVDVHTYFRNTYERCMSFCEPIPIESYFSPYRRWFGEENCINVKINKRRLYNGMRLSARKCYTRFHARKRFSDYGYTVVAKELFRIVWRFRLGIQIATTGRIFDFSAGNHVYFDVNRTIQDYSVLWERWGTTIEELDKLLYSLCFPNGFESEKLI